MDELNPSAEAKEEIESSITYRFSDSGSKQKYRWSMSSLNESEALSLARVSCRYVAPVNIHWLLAVLQSEIETLKWLGSVPSGFTD